MCVNVATMTGQVIADALNLRASPGGPVVGILKGGTHVEITGRSGDWLRVCAGSLSGFVSSRYVRLEPILPQEESGEPRVVGNEALAPDGTCFARAYKGGFYGYGTTTIDAFVMGSPHRFATMPESTARVLRAVSENEGRYEAINTWDNAFLSFGVFQWTSGVAGEPGELPALIQRLSHDHPDSFEACFGRYGLSTTAVSSGSGTAQVGHFSLNGVRLGTAEAKAALRSLQWAYRFWKAGHDDNVREVQTIHAMERIDLFLRNGRLRIRGFLVGEYVTSECGVALMLDQHVNRPGHVPTTLAKAVEALAGEIDVQHPERWGDNEERRLLMKYLELRRASSMTDSASRAEKILARADSGAISMRRNSYTL